MQFQAGKVEKKLKQLKPSAALGPDRVWTRVLHTMAEVLANPLSVIFGRLMGEGEVPGIWRKANVCPIFKKGTKGDPANYRPVSLTCVVGKVMESLIRDELVAHLERFNLIRGSQHGFMGGRSTTTNLLVYLETLTRLINEGHCVDVLYLDFAKAFDKVPHGKLMDKCRGLGVGGRVLEWIRKWLANREQRVILNGVTSGWREVLSGVPQGSVLGPTLFLIFINDIDEVAKVNAESILLKFADDTKLGVVVETEEQREALQEAIRGLEGWADKWQMEFNASKCHVLHLGRRNNEYSYTMGGVELARVEEEKDVGVMIHHTLKPSLQCAKASARANQVLGQLARGVGYRDKVTFLQLYRVYVRPHLEYAVVSWCPWSKGDRDCLEKVQRRALGMVTNLQAGTYESRLREAGMTTLQARRERGDMITTFRIMEGHDRVDRSTWFKTVEEGRGAGVRTRQGTAGQLTKEPLGMEIRRNFFSQRVVDPWNSLSEAIRRSSTVNTFKNNYDQWVLGGG